MCVCVFFFGKNNEVLSLAFHGLLRKEFVNFENLLMGICLSQQIKAENTFFSGTGNSLSSSVSPCFAKFSLLFIYNSLGL